MIDDGLTYWGVDPSSKAISIAYRNFGVWGVKTSKFDGKLKDGARLLDIHDCTINLARELMVTAPPSVVWVEQPSGKRPNPSLSYAVGVIIFSIYEALATEYAFPVSVHTIPSTSWKKAAIGNGHGNAGKEEIMEWARLIGYEGEVQDECDAIGVAYAAQKMVGFAAE